MPHSQSFEAIVLKTYDVGEADRFCVLFTRERGRIAARASGARRLNSRLGGAILPFQHITVELKEGSAGWIVAGAVRHTQERSAESISAFAALEEGIELLLRLVTDEGALPDVFEATMSFVNASRDGFPHASLAYAFALLHCLGFLPGDSELIHFATLESAEFAYLQQCRCGIIAPPHSYCDHQKLFTLRSTLLNEHLTSPLKTAGVIAAMA